MVMLSAAFVAAVVLEAPMLADRSYDKKQQINKTTTRPAFCSRARISCQTGDPGAGCC